MSNVYESRHARLHSPKAPRKLPSIPARIWWCVGLAAIFVGAVGFTAIATAGDGGETTRTLSPVPTRSPSPSPSPSSAPIVGPPATTVPGPVTVTKTSTTTQTATETKTETETVTATVTETVTETASGSPTGVPSAPPSTTSAPAGLNYVNVYLTGYVGTGTDNDCDGGGGDCTAYPPYVAGGNFTYENPTTLAVFPGVYEVPTLIWIEGIGYAKVGDDCMNCYTSEHNKPWIDLWCGDDEDAMNAITGDARIVIDPPPGLPHPGLPA